MSQELVASEIQDRILILRLQRPEKKNALTLAMYESLSAALRKAEEDAQIRAIVLTGTRDCFTSGNDIADFLQRPPKADGDTPVGRFMNDMLNAKKPVLAAVEGLAIGIGVTVLLHCDLVFAGAGARLQMPFVNIGICPEFGSSELLPRMMGHQRAAELVLLGEPFTAEKARDYGLVNTVCPDGEAEARALEAARKLAAQPPAALRASKALLKRGTQTVAETIRLEAETFIPMLRGPEALEAMSAFMQKRKPDFSRFS